MKQLANIKSAKKRIKVIAKKTELNKKRKVAMKSALKQFDEAITSGDVKLAQEKFRAAQKRLDKVATKNTIHKNKAARKVARLAKKLSNLENAAQ